MPQQDLSRPLEVGVVGDAHDQLAAPVGVLLALTFLVGVLTVVPGRATRLQGVVHLVLLSAFLFLAVNP
jgi:Ca2+:H+ antiporter